MPVAKSVTILTNGEELVENRDEDMSSFMIETRGIKEVVGDQKVENVVLQEGKNLRVDGIFIAVRNGI